MHLIKLLLICVGISTSILSAQPNDLWFRTYDGDGGPDGFSDIYACDDGGFAMCGRSYTENRSHFWLVRTNSAGGVLWSSRLRLAGIENRLNSLVETDDGGFIAVGVASEGGAVGQVAAIRYTEEGDTLWYRTYGGGSDEEGYAVIELKSNEFLIAGKTNSIGAGHFDGYLLKINGDGDLIWDNAYGTDEYEYFLSLREIDGGVFVAGKQYRNGQYDFWLVQVNEDGEQVNSINFGNNNLNEYLTNMTSIPGGGYALCGYSISNDNEHGFVLVRTNAQGQQEFIRYYNLIEGAHRNDDCLAVTAFPNDGGFGLVGTAQQGENRNGVASFLRVSGAGEFLWQRFTDYSDDDENDRHSNEFTSVVIQRGRLVITGGVIMENTFFNGLLAMVTPEHSAPEIILYQPDPLELDVLLGDTATFSVKILDLQDDSISYLWTLNGDVIESDTTANDTSAATIAFDELGDNTVFCRVSDVDLADSVNWIVHVKELDIDSYSPDSMNLIVRPNTTVDFMVTSQATEGDPVEYAWLLNDEQIGDEDSLSITFEEVSDYEVIAVAYREEQSDSIAWLVEVKEMYIDGYCPDSLNLTVMRDRSVEFSVSVDAFEGDSIEYQWLLDDEEIDSVFNDTLAIAFENSGDYQLEAIAFTEDGRDSVEWNIAVVNMIVDYIPREFDIAVNIDTVMEFSIEPFNPDDPSLNILWTVDDDSVDNRSWTFIDFDTAGEYQVDVYVSDSTSADSMSWNVRVNPNAVTEHDLALLPSVSTLYPPSPNPFNSQTSVRYALPVGGEVRLELYDVGGRLVSELVNQRQVAGWYDVVVDGSGMVSGVYFVRMVVNSNNTIRKVVLIR